MSDDDRDFKYYANKKRRRKKVTEDASQNWDQSKLISELEAAKRKGRLLCKRCHVHKPWSKLVVAYERVSKRWIQQVWYCPDCGNALKTLDICVRPKKRKKVKPTP